MKQYNATSKKWIVLLMLFIFCWSVFLPAAYADESPQKVMIITVDDAVELGLSSYLERNIKAAEDAGADLIILELDTPGVVWMLHRISSVFFIVPG